MMKSISKLFGRVVALALVLAFGASALFARVTPPAPARTAPDTWCVGRVGAEVCVDYSGNLVPTSDDDTTLGTSSLSWSSAYIDDMVVGSTVTDSANFNGLVGLGFHATPDASVTPLRAYQLIVNTTVPELCMSTGTAVGAWVRVSTPTLACQN